MRFVLNVSLNHYNHYDPLETVPIIAHTLCCIIIVLLDVYCVYAICEIVILLVKRFFFRSFFIYAYYVTRAQLQWLKHLVPNEGVPIQPKIKKKKQKEKSKCEQTRRSFCLVFILFGRSVSLYIWKAWLSILTSWCWNMKLKGSIIVSSIYAQYVIRRQIQP